MSTTVGDQIRIQGLGFKDQGSGCRGYRRYRVEGFRIEVEKGLGIFRQRLDHQMERNIK